VFSKTLFELEQATGYDAVCQAMKAAAYGRLRHVMAYTDQSVVSTDFRGDPAASIFDAGAGIMLDDTFLKVVAWYDNEYGYTCNLVRLTQHLFNYKPVMEYMHLEELEEAETV